MLRYLFKLNILFKQVLIDTQLNGLMCYAYIGNTVTGTLGTTANCSASQTYCTVFD